MALQGAGYQVVGFSLFGQGPVDGMHLELNQGWTALYGLNGAGKTTILNAIAHALSGFSRHEANERSCVHITLSQDVEDATDPVGSFLIALRAALGRPLGPNGPSSDDHFMALVDKLLLQIESDGSVGDDQEKGAGDDDSREDHWFWTDPYSEHDPIAFSLIPSGRPGSPEWEVYLSAHFTEKMRDAAKEISVWWDRVLAGGSKASELWTSRPVALSWFTDEKHWTPDDLDEPAPALNWPLGLPIPMRKLTTIDTAPVLVSRPMSIDDLNAVTRRSILSERVRVAPDQSLVGMADESTLILADWLTAHRQRLQGRANTLYRKTFRDPPNLLLDLKHPDQWFAGEAPEWQAQQGAAEFPFDGLSNSQQRWASLSISSVLAQRDATRPSLLVVDEPESGLHRSAEQILPSAMRALVASGSSVLTATHSPALLSPTDISAGRLLHIVMADGRTLPPRPVELGVTGSLRDLALTSGLGLTASDLLTTMRVAVWVEGEHDVAVLQHFLGSELAEAGAHLFPLHGAIKAPALADAGVLLDITDATLVVIVDHVDGARARELWGRAQAQAEAGQVLKARGTLSQFENLNTAEGRWLADLGRRALELTRLHRIVPLPLSRFDIACYLPVELLVPTAPSWGQLHHEYEQAHPKGPNRLKFKDYLATIWGSPITTETIKLALSQVGETPEEIYLLGEDIKRIGLLPSSDPLEIEH